MIFDAVGETSCNAPKFRPMLIFMSTLTVYDKIKAGRETAAALLPAKFGERLRTLEPEILEMPEFELERHFQRTPTDYQLRKRLWMLVEQAVDGAMISVCAAAWSQGICSSQYMNTKILMNPHRVAWLFTPLETFKAMYEDTFHVGFNKIRNYVLETSISDKNFGFFLQFMKEFGDRVVGPVPKRIQGHFKTEDVTPAQSPAPSNLIDLDAEIRRLEEAKADHAKLVTQSDVDPE